MENNLFNRALLIIEEAKINGEPFPSFKTFSDGLGGLSRDRTREILKRLVASGKIFKAGPNYSFYPFETKNAKEERKPKTVKDKIKAVPINWANLAMALVMGFVGIGAIRMSVFHSAKFLRENFYSPGMALFAACVFVLFEVGGIDLGLKFVKEKGRRLIGGAMVFLGFISMLFSVWSTIGGLYSERAEDLARADGKRAELTAEASINGREWDSIQKQIERAEKAVESERTKRDGLIRDKNGLKPGTYEYNSVNYAIIQSDRALRIAEDRLSEKMDIETQFLSKGEITGIEAVKIEESEVIDFYRWVGGRVFPGIRADLLEFWLSCLPAILYDTLATLAVAVVLWHLPIKRED